MSNEQRTNVSINAETLTMWYVFKTRSWYDESKFEVLFESHGPRNDVSTHKRTVKPGPSINLDRPSLGFLRVLPIDQPWFIHQDGIVGPKCAAGNKNLKKVWPKSHGRKLALHNFYKTSKFHPPAPWRRQQRTFVLDLNVFYAFSYDVRQVGGSNRDNFIFFKDILGYKSIPFDSASFVNFSTGSAVNNQLIPDPDTTIIEHMFVYVSLYAKRGHQSIEL